MSSMFESCFSLTSINITTNYFGTSSVTNMENMFKNCGNLTDIDVDNFDTSKVTNMRSMFENCETLIFLNTSNFNTEKLKICIKCFLIVNQSVY